LTLAVLLWIDTPASFRRGWLQRRNIKGSVQYVSKTGRLKLFCLCLGKFLGTCVKGVVDSNC
jgi:hypothetical protein